MRYLIGALFAGTLALWILWLAQGEELAPPRGPLTAVSPGLAPGDVRIEVWTDKSRVTVGKPLTCTMTVVNQLPVGITFFRLVAVNHEGFQPASPSSGARSRWNGDRLESFEADGKTSYGSIPTTIPAGHSITMIAPLVAQDPGRSMVGGSFAWQAGDAGRSRSVNAGPVLVERAWWGAGRATRTFLKDIGWPIVLALLGYFFKKAEEAQTRLRETWSLMFPLSHARAEKYWMPLASSMVRRLPTPPRRRPCVLLPPSPLAPDA
jgi:hypothetical protein